MRRSREDDGSREENGKSNGHGDPEEKEKIEVTRDERDGSPPAKRSRAGSEDEVDKYNGHVSAEDEEDVRDDDDRDEVVRSVQSGEDDGRGDLSSEE